MPRNNEDKAILISLIAFGAFIAGVPLLFMLAAVWEAGFGFNRTTLVFMLAAFALVGVFVFWLKRGAVVVPPEPDPEVLKAKQLDFWGRLKWQYKQDFHYKVLGILGIVIAVLLAVGYVEYIEPLLK